MGADLAVRRAVRDDLDRLVPAYVEAAADEAVSTWIQGEHEFPEGFADAYLTEFLGRSIRDDEVWIAVADGDILGVSVWVEVRSLDRFEAEADEAAAAVAEHGTPERTALVTRLVADTHPREFPHLYLYSIAVAPAHRGLGVGAAILTERLRLAADSAQPVFLEASTERSALLYERCGFVRTGTTHRLPDGGPELIPMWRR
jgi:GNAT superfamily N-acetyltransferase